VWGNQNRIRCILALKYTTSGGNNFNDFPEIVPTRKITTKTEKTFLFVIHGRISSMGAMLQHQQHPS